MSSSISIYEEQATALRMKLKGACRWPHSPCFTSQLLVDWTRGVDLEWLLLEGEQSIKCPSCTQYAGSNYTESAHRLTISNRWLTLPYASRFFYACYHLPAKQRIMCSLHTGRCRHTRAPHRGRAKRKLASGCCW